MAKLQNLSIEQLAATSSGISTLFQHFFMGGNADSINREDQFNLYFVCSYQSELQVELRARILSKIGQMEFESSKETE